MNGNQEFSLEELLNSSPAGSFTLSDEDKAWLNMAPVGKEIIDWGDNPQKQNK